jgi:signal transduction histidine kinase/ActR/RegA family two-component response regulator
MSVSTTPPVKQRLGEEVRWGVIGREVAAQSMLFCAILLAAFVAMRLISLPPTNVTAIWLPAGIALLALRTRPASICGPTLLLAHWAIIALANDYPYLSPRPWSLVMATANTVAPLMGAWIWQKWLPRGPFADNWGFLRFLGGVALLPALLTAWVIPTVIYLAGYLPEFNAANLLSRIGSITLSSTLGVFLVVPLVESSWTGGLLKKAVAWVPAQLANAALALLIAWVGFHVSSVNLFLAIPVTFLSAIVCGPRGLGIALFIIITYGLLATQAGHGPFAGAHADPTTSLLEMAAAALCLGAPAYFAGLTFSQLLGHRDKLEHTVAERTRQLQLNEERYRLATEAASEGVFDWQDGSTLSFANASIRRKLGPAISTTGTDWITIWRLVHSEDREQLGATLRAFMFGSDNVFSVDSRLLTPSGNWCWFQAKGKVLERDAQGRARRVVGTFKDTQADKQRWLDLTAARDQADSRGRAKDTFLANMSHEIRTPMHAMLGFARILDESELDPKQRECVNAILSSGDLLLELLNDLLDLSRIEAGAIKLDPAPASLAEVASQALRLFESQAAAKQLKLDLTLASDLPPLLSFDRLRVHQIITNLLSNAVKFTETGSVSMAVTVERQPTGRPNDHPHWLVHLQVSDTGIGMTGEQINRLFSPFMQADSSITRRFGGSGLGLAISRHLCEIMGGTIRVTSRTGHGSVFTANFLTRETTPFPDTPADKSEDATSEGPFPSLQVLVVEDNRLNQRLAIMMLQRLGHQPHLAQHGAEALEKLPSLDIDLVLMDLQMPEMDGFAATQAIREREAASGGHMPIIALTANAGAEERNRCLAAGMDDYLTKPLDLETFRTTLQRVHRRFSTSPGV